MLLRPNVNRQKKLDENELDKSELRRKCTKRNVTEPMDRFHFLKNDRFVLKRRRKNETIFLKTERSLFRSFIFIKQ